MIASRVRLMLLGVLVVFAVSVVASSPASALPTEGPFWQVNGAKLPQGVKKNVVDSLHKAGSLYAVVGPKWIKITCESGPSTGQIFNGTQHGESTDKIKFSKCTEIEEATEKHGVYKEIAGCKFEEPIEVSAVDSLWYHSTNLNRTRTNKIQVGFFPEANGGGVFTVLITNAACGALHGEFEVFGDVAAEPSPQYTEVLEGQLIFPTEQQDHLWQPKNTPEETQQALHFAGKSADLVAEANVRLEPKEPFGVIE